MTPEAIRGLIEECLGDTHESSNDVYLAHRAGIFRGLIWVLTATDPGAYLTTDTAKICQLAGIPYRLSEDGRMVHYG